jgi:hypothetical protein
MGKKSTTIALISSLILMSVFTLVIANTSLEKYEDDYHYNYGNSNTTCSGCNDIDEDFVDISNAIRGSRYDPEVFIRSGGMAGFSTFPIDTDQYYDYPPPPYNHFYQSNYPIFYPDCSNVYTPVTQNHLFNQHVRDIFSRVFRR